jgi:hypothetical protein
MNETNQIDQINQTDRVLVRGARWFWAKPGCVLEDALWAGVVNELLATDVTFLHRKLAPSAEAIGEIG